MSLTKFTQKEFLQLTKPRTNSHKGDNGRLLVIGGSKLFHAAVFWTADVASRFVDLVHFTSPAKENNDLVRYKMKQGFWNGIVVDWKYIDTYIQEDAAIVIGPGMPREEGLIAPEIATKNIIDDLLTRFPDKRWVVDGGALQEVDPNLLNRHMIITPHLMECERIITKLENKDLSVKEFKRLSLGLNNPRQKHFQEIADYLAELSLALNGVIILLKSVRDIVVNPDLRYLIEGGNEGLTKGGTGDVLAGLVGSFYTANPPVVSAAGASFVLKHAADKLYEQTGPYYNSTDLVDGVSYAMKELRS